MQTSPTPNETPRTGRDDTKSLEASAGSPRLAGKGRAPGKGRAASVLGWLARLGTAGAIRNAAQALDQHRRAHEAVAALEARLE